MIEAGSKGSFSKTITESDIVAYAGITGDFNPAHIDEEQAKKGVFGGRVAHGMLSAGLISAVLGTKMPGEGTVYLSQSLKFCSPVRVGDTVTADCVVDEILNKEKGIYRIHTACVNQDGVTVIDGEAVVKYLPEDKAGQGACQLKGHDTFYSGDELQRIGLKRYGMNVRISRNAVLYNPEQLEVGNNVRIDDFTTISGKAVLGDYIHIAQFCGLYGGTEGIYMDDFSGLSSRVVIYAVSNDYSGESLTNPTVPQKYKETDKSMKVHLCKHVIVGTTSVILPGVTVGTGSSVGAMSMCPKDLGEWGIYAGSPAKKIKERSRRLLELEKRLREEESARGGIICRHKLNFKNLVLQRGCAA